MSPRVSVVCGSGGVGKTTTAAAIGLAAAQSGQRVLVVTVDPARRLAQALGAEGIGHEPVHVECGGSGTLQVSMLDTKAGWDALIRRHARDAASAERVLRNPLYDNITSRFVNSHDYIAMEQVNELSRRDDLDLVVIDTPPSRNALDLLDAPRRMREFFGGRLLQWLTLPYRSRVLSIASRPFLQIADRLLGAQFLGDIAEFFTLLQSMEAGFVRRAREVEELLSSERVECTVVTTAEPAPAAEAVHMVEELRRRRFRVERIVANRVETGAVDEQLPGTAEIAAHVAIGDAARLTTALDGVRAAHDRRAGAATRHARQVEILGRTGVAVAVVADAGADGGSGALGAIVAVMPRG